MIEQYTFKQDDIILQAGDRLLMYTDGVVESSNELRELFGEDRLIDLVRASSGRTASQLISSLRDSLQQYTNRKSPTDDTTIIVMDLLTKR